MTRKYTQEEFISLSESIHGSKYDYSLVDYRGMHHKVKIICPAHGEFVVKPNSHTSRKSGCAECAKLSRASKNRIEISEIFQRIEAVHGDTYAYDNSFVYVNKDSKLRIKCKTHGWFSQSVHNHTFNEQGCPSCSKSGYDFNKPGRLYVLIAEKITKVGITNLSADRRRKLVSRSANIPFSVHIEYYFDDGNVPSKIETILLRYLRLRYQQPQQKFQGHSECFYDVDRADLIAKLEELIQEHTDAHNKT